jgi:hypothetical protein
MLFKCNESAIFAPCLILGEFKKNLPPNCCEGAKSKAWFT